MRGLLVAALATILTIASPALAQFNGQPGHVAVWTGTNTLGSGPPASNIPGGGGGGGGGLTSFNGRTTAAAALQPGDVTVTVPGFNCPTAVAGQFGGSLTIGCAVTVSDNQVYAGPCSGASASPTFRGLCAADIPALPYAGISGTPTAGDCTAWTSPTQIGDSGAPCGGSGGVTSWNGRTGAVTLTNADITALLTSADIVSALGYTPCGNVTLTAGSYTSVNLTVSAGGCISAISNGSGGGGSGALVLIQEIQVTSNTASVTFAAISGTYSHLQVKAKFGSTGTNYTSSDGLLFQFNGDTGSDYAYNGIGWYNGASAFGFNSASSTSITPCIASMTGSSQPIGQCSAEIISYADSANYKTMFADYLYFQGNVGLAQGTAGGEWRNSSPITSITLSIGNGDDIVAGSTFWLYGVN